MVSTVHTLEARVEAGGVSEFQSAMQGASAATIGFREKVAAAGAALVALSAGGIAASTKQFATFDKAMQESIAVMGDVGEAQRENLVETAREVATTTSKSHEEAAESFYYLASAGLDAAESMEAMPVVAEYSEAAQQDMAEATDVATNAMTAYGLKADEIARVTDVMTETFTSSNTTAQQLGEALEYVAPVASSAGMSIEETNAILSGFAQVGITGSKAGTSLRNAISRLLNPSAEAAKTLKRLGISATDASGNLRPMDEIVQQLEQSGASTADIMEIFGQRAGPAMAALVRQGSDSLRDQQAALEGAEGATRRVAETQRDSLIPQLQILKSQLADVAITTGSQFEPALLGLVGRVQDAVGAFAEWNGALGGLPAAIALVVGLVSGLAATFVAFPGSVGLATAALTTFVTVAGGLAAVAAPIAAFAAAYQTNFAGIKDATDEVITVLGQEFTRTVQTAKTAVLPILTTIAGAFATLGGDVEAEVSGIVQQVKGTLIEGIRAAGSSVRQQLFAIAAYWTEHRAQIIQASTDAYNAARDAVDTAVSTIEDVVQSALDRAQQLWDQHGQQVVDVATDAYNRVRDAIGPTLETLQEIGERVLSRLGQLWDDLKSAVQGAADVIVPRLQDFGRELGLLDEQGRLTNDGLIAVAGSLTALAGPIGIAIAAASKLFIAWKNDIGGLQGVTERAFSAIEDAITAGIDLAKQAVEIGGDAIDLIWSQSGQRWVDTLSLWIDRLVDIVRGVGEAIIQVLAPVLDRIEVFWDQHGEDLVFIAASFIQLISETIRIGLETIIKITEPILSFIADLWDDHGQVVVGLVEWLVDTTISVIGAFIDTLATVIRAGMAIIEGDWETAWEELAGLAERIADGIVDYVEKWAGTLIDTIAQWVDDVIGWFEDLYDALIGSSIVPDMLDAIVDAFEGFIETVVSAVDTFVADLIDFFTTLKDDALSLVDELYQGFTDTIDTLATEAYDRIDTFATDAIDRVTTLKDDAISRAEEMKKQVVEKLNKLKEEGIEKIKELATGIMDFLTGKKGPLGNIKSAGETLVSDFASGIKSKIQDVKNAAGKVADAAAEKIGVSSNTESGPLSKLESFGPELTRTFASGILDKIRQVRQAASKLAAAANPNARANVGVGLGAAGSTFRTPQLSAPRPVRSSRRRDRNATADAVADSVHAALRGSEIELDADEDRLKELGIEGARIVVGEIEDSARRRGRGSGRGSGSGV